jgi:hypothetical protein
MKPIADRQAEVEAIHGEIFAERIARRQANTTTRGPTAPNNVDDAQLLDKARGAKNGVRFAALYDLGNWQAEGFPSQSEADAALAGDLMFWTGNGQDRTDRLFRNSALMRDKWNRQDYRERTLDLATVADPYKGRRAKLKVVSINVSRVEEPQAPKYPYPVLKDAALVGIAGEFVELISPESEADRASLLIQFLIIAGCALGRGSYYEVEAARHHANLFGIAVGPSSLGRKGTAYGHAERVAFEAGVLSLLNVRTGLSSGEGIIHAVRDALLDEEGNVVDAGVSDKRMLLYAPEFSQALKVIRREGNTLSETLRFSYDTGNLHNLIKNSPDMATGAHIACLGHITQIEFLSLLEDIEVGNGLLTRFLIFCSQRSKELPFGGNINQEALKKFIARFQTSINQGRNLGRMTWRPEAAEKWRTEYSRLSAGRPGLLGALTSRAEAKCARLTTLYAALRGSSEFIVEDLDAGLAVWQYCYQSARFIFGQRLGNIVADRILAALRNKPEGLTRTDINNSLGRHADAERINAALQLLRQEQLAYSEEVKTSGRPSEVWKPRPVGEAYLEERDDGNQDD